MSPASLPYLIQKSFACLLLEMHLIPCATGHLGLIMRQAIPSV